MSDKPRNTTRLKNTQMSMATRTGDPRADAISLNKLGCDYFEKGFHDKALDVFTRARDLVPEFVGFASNLAAVQLSLGKVDEAIRTLSSFPQRDGSDPAFTLSVGRAIGESGRAQDEIDLYRRSLKIHSDQPEMLHNLAIAYLDVQSVPEAMTTVDQLLEISPEWPEAHFLRGCVLSASGSPVEEAEAYRKAIELKADYREAWQNLGAVLREQTKFLDAAAAFRSLAGLKADDPQPATDEAICLWLGGRHEDAIDRIQEVLSSRPGYFPALTSASLFFVHRGEAARALETMEKAASLYPKSPETLYCKGLVLQVTGDLEGALKAFEGCLSAAELKRDVIEHHRCELLIKLGRHEQAIPPLERLLDAEPADHFARALLARALKDSGNPDRAREVAAGAKDRPGDDVPSLWGIAELLMELGDRETCEVLLGRILKKDPDNADAAHALGVVHSRARRYDEALVHFEKAFRLRPEFSQASYNLAMIHYTRKNYELARKVLELAIKTDPENVRPRHLLAKCHRKMGNLKEALAVWEEALPLRSDSKSILKHLVEVCAELGEQEKGRRYLSQARDLKKRLTERRRREDLKSSPWDSAIEAEDE